MRAADDQSLPREQVGFRVEVIVQGEHILRALIVTVLQALFAYGDELAFVAGGPAALGEPVDRGIPEDVLFAVHDPLDIGLQVVVFLDRNGLFEIADREGFGKIVFTSELGILSGGDQMLQNLPLDCNWVVNPFLYTSQTQSRKS